MTGIIFYDGAALILGSVVFAAVVLAVAEPRLFGRATRKRRTWIEHCLIGSLNLVGTTLLAIGATVLLVLLNGGPVEGWGISLLIATPPVVSLGIAALLYWIS